VHDVLRDNARNMLKGMEEVGVRSVGCLAHTLQLSVKAGLESQGAAGDAVNVCRRIATLRTLHACQGPTSGYPAHDPRLNAACNTAGTFNIQKIKLQHYFILFYCSLYVIGTIYKSMPLMLLLNADDTCIDLIFVSFFDYYIYF